MDEKNTNVICVSEQISNQCNQCDETDNTTKKCSIISHVNVLTKENPYQCQQCKIDFLSKIDLENHEITHSENMPFQCLECGSHLFSIIYNNDRALLGLRVSLR